MGFLVFAAVAAMFFAPSQHAGTSVAGASATSITPAEVSAELGSDVLDPWAKPVPASAPVGGLATDAAALAAGDVRDPWAPRPQAPPGPVVLVDRVIDPWSSAPPAPRRLRTPLANPRGVVDPWAPPTDLHAPPQPVAPPRPGSDLRDPWRKPTARSAATNDGANRGPSARRAVPPATGGVMDPWRSSR